MFGQTEDVETVIWISVNINVIFVGLVGNVMFGRTEDLETVIWSSVNIFLYL